MTPETRYAKSGDLNIAYQVVGDGPLDLVFVYGFVSHVEAAWDDPMHSRFLERLASFSRLIIFDKRGTGLSDRVPLDELPTLEERMDDVRAVMDAAGSRRAALFGISEGGPMAALFAATYPERTRSLILCGTYARGARAPDYPLGPELDVMDRAIRLLGDQWGGPVGIAVFAPSLEENQSAKQAWARYLRLSASPAAAIGVMRMVQDIDVRSVLRTISAPTLVIHRKGDRLVRIDQGRDLAQRIPGAKFVELPGSDHLAWVNSDDLVSEVQEFLTGLRPTAEPDRVLATVMFTDIVGSTEKVYGLGDSRWRDVLAAHNNIAQREISQWRGRQIKNTGDGVLATFDGPGRAIRCAAALTEAVKPLGIEVRSGLHTGECELLGEDIGGISVHIAARVASLAAAGEVLVSRTVKDLVAGSGITFEDRGKHVLKGVPDEWDLFAANP